MRRALIYKVRVAQVADVDFPVAPELFWVDCPDDCIVGWVYDPETGIVAAPVPKPLDAQETYKKYKLFIDNTLNTESLNRGFDGVLDFLSFDTSSNKIWSDSAIDFRNFRDAMKTYADPVYKDILDETGNEPTFEDFKANIPNYLV